MDVNPVATSSPGPTNQLSTSSGRLHASASTRNHEPALRLDASPAAGQRQGGTVQDKTTDSDDLKEAERLKALISDKNVRLRTYHDEASGRDVLEVRDQTTGDVVSQYPSDDLLRLYAALRQPLVDQNA